MLSKLLGETKFLKMLHSVEQINANIKEYMKMLIWEAENTKTTLNWSMPTVGLLSRHQW